MPMPMRLPIRFVTLAVLLLLVLSGCAASKNELTARMWMQQEQLRARGAEQSLSAEEAADRLKNLSPAEHLQRGNAALAAEDATLARLHYTLALAKDETLEAAYLGLAETLIREGKAQEAKAVLQKSLTQPGRIYSLARLGTLCRAFGENAHSLQYLLQANQLAPDSAWLLTELAISYEQAGEMAQADSHFRKVVRLLPESAVALNNLGFNLLLQGRYAEAVTVLKNALRLAPDNSLTMNNLAIARAFSDDRPAALRLFADAVGPAGAYNNLGYLLLLQRQEKAAKQALSKALELDPVFYVRAWQNLDMLKSGEEERSGLTQ